MNRETSRHVDNFFVDINKAQIVFFLFDYKHAFYYFQARQGFQKLRCKGNKVKHLGKLILTTPLSSYTAICITAKLENVTER